MAEEDISAVWKTWQVYWFGKRNVFRFEPKESGDGFRGKERARSFHVEGPKTKKAQEPGVEILVRGIWRLSISKGTTESTVGFCQEFNCFKCAGVVVFSI